MGKAAIFSEESRNYSGIYAIVNTANNRVYIGRTSLSFSERWNAHRRDLERNRHPNLALQDDWNVFGRSAFEFRIIERTKRFDSSYDYAGSEMRYIRASKLPLYNIFI